MPKGRCTSTGRPHNWKPPVKSTCEICGKEITIPHKGEHGRKHTCGSKDCIRKLMSERQSGSSNHNYKPPIEKVCPICNTIFYEKPGHYNSRVCCSRECASKWRKIKFSGENSPLYQQRITTECSECGKEIQRLKWDLEHNQLTFCSVDCFARWKSKHTGGENHWNWKGGITKDPYCEKFTPEFRERVRAYWGYACVECGTPAPAHVTKSGKLRKLTVHHVHYDKKMCCNGSPRDVVALCNVCNIRANTNRNYWEEHFTNMIYALDPEGKCYFTKDEMISLYGSLRK